MKLKTKLRKLNLKLTSAFWVDVEFKKYKKENISDDYLKNICYFIAQGNGWPEFIHNEKRIYKIFEEAYKRKILRVDIIFNLHCWALFYNGFSTYKPKYFGEPTRKDLDELEKSLAI